MKHAIIAKGIVLAVFFCTAFASACTVPTPELIIPTVTLPLVTAPAATVTETYPPTVEPSVTLPAATNTPIHRKTEQSAPVINGGGPWAAGLNIKEVGQVLGGDWSPANDEIVFVADQPSDSHDVILVRAAAPDFQPQEIRAVSPIPYGIEPCIYPGLLWSENGQQLFFSGPQENPSMGGMEPCSIWMVERDGSSPRRYYPEQKGRSFSPDGWLDDHTIILSGYREGIHIFDLLEGETVNWAMPRYYGISFTTRDFLVGTKGDVLFNMYAVGSRDEPYNAVMRDSENNMRYALTPPPDSTYEWTGQPWDGYTIAYDAIPNTNQVLGYWFQDVVHSEGEKILKIFRVQKLVLWDIDQNILSTLVPYGLWGRFSPDGSTLAYLTRGPAMVDAENRPVDPNSLEGFDPYALDEKETYLQLLDRDTGSIFLSVPVASQYDFADYDYLHVGANFSADGRFLSFITNRKIAFDDQGWPEMVQPESASEEGGHLYVLDVINRRLVWDQGDLAPIPKGEAESKSVEQRIAYWSPTRSQFFYIGAENNLILVDLDAGVSTPVTVNTSDAPGVEWSSSGDYAAIWAPAGRHSWQAGILQIP